MKDFEFEQTKEKTPRVRVRLHIHIIQTGPIGVSSHLFKFKIFHFGIKSTYKS